MRDQLKQIEIYNLLAIQLKLVNYTRGYISVVSMYLCSVYLRPKDNENNNEAVS